jgi:hypothetical protein
MQFGISDSIFLMNKAHNGTTFGVGKCFITTHGVVSSVFGDIFTSPIGDGVYKVEVYGVMLPKQVLMFLTCKYDLPQLLVNDAKGQFTIAKGASTQEPICS